MLMRKKLANGKLEAFKWISCSTYGQLGRLQLPEEGSGTIQTKERHGKPRKIQLDAEIPSFHVSGDTKYA
jgi:hypothetical protein